MRVTVLVDKNLQNGEYVMLMSPYDYEIYYKSIQENMGANDGKKLNESTYFGFM